MPSHDLRISIERYPHDDEGCSWGCPDLNLMGYETLEALLFDIHTKLIGMMGLSSTHQRGKNGG